MKMGLMVSLLKKTPPWIAKVIGSVNNFDFVNKKDSMGFGVWPVYWILNENMHFTATGTFCFGMMEENIPWVP